MYQLEESDRLIEIISKLYEKPIKTKFSDKKIVFVALSLNEEKANLENGSFRFKIFFNEEDGLYSEFYLNTDLINGTVELREKDEEYRASIIKVLSGE